MRAFRIGVVWLCLLACSSFAQSQTLVYYSVGTNAADLKSGSPTVTLSSGTATFTLAQPNNIGVGDEVTYNGGTIAYISGRTSSTMYSLVTVLGATPPDVAGAPVNAIRRAFNSLKNAALQSDTASYLNTANLVAGNYQLNWPCYNDGPDTSDQVLIEEPWITGPANYIRAYTPTDPSEVGVSQRHNGTAGTGYRIAPTTSSPAEPFYFLLVGNDTGYVRIEGLEIDGSGVTNGESLRGIRVHDTSGSVEDVRISHNLVHDLRNSTIDDTDESDVVGILMSTANNSKVSNNIIYNLIVLSANALSNPKGIETSVPGTLAYVYNNTLYNILNVVSTSNAKGINDDDNTIIAKNNYVGLVDSVNGTENCFTGTFLQEAANVSSDASAAGPGSQINKSTYASYFVSVTPGSEDLHLLANSNTLWGSFGADLNGDANLPVTDDIDGAPRDPSQPDIGADESRIAVFYSVGTAVVDLKNGSPTVTLSSGNATFSVAQPNDVGVGDEITYNGGTKAYISGRTSFTLYQLTTATGARPPDIAGATVNSILRAFNSLSTAEAGSSNASHLNTLDLVAGSYQLNWTCYDDGPMDDTVTIDGYTTGASNYIHIYTPTQPSEVGASQRHNGTAGTGFRLAPSIGAPPVTQRILIIRDDDVRITGVELDGSGITNAQNIEGLFVGPSVSATGDIRLESLIVHDLQSQDGTGVDSDVNGLRFDNGSVKLSNSILYDIAQTTANANARARGVRSVGGSNHYLFSNTVFNIKNTGNALESHGIYQEGGTVNVQNTVVLDVLSTSGPEGCFGGTLTQNNNVSSDTTAVGAGSQTNQTTYASYFVSITPGSEDLHLLNNSNALWGSFGADLDSDANLPVTDDIDGGLRDATQPDIGADEFGVASLSLTLADHDSGQVADKFTVTSPVTDVLFRFKLSRSGTVNVDTLRVHFTTGTGVANGDVSAGELWTDNNNDGVINGGDTMVQGGVAPAAGVLTFTTNFSPAASGTHYLVRATVANLVAADSTAFSAGTADIDEVEGGVTESGSITNATHIQDSAANLTQFHYLWRNDDGGEAGGSDSTEVNATASTATTGTGSYEALAGMSIAPGAGDYLVWFSGTLRNSITGTQLVSLFLDGSQITHTEREITTESSIPSSRFVTATHAYIPGVTAGQAINVRWQTSAGTATMLQRTLVVTKVTAADVTQATATGLATETNTSDTLINSMTLTPGVGDYLVWFSGSNANTAAPSKNHVLLYVNGAPVTHTEREIDQEGSLGSTFFPTALHARVTGVGAGQPIEVRWRVDTGTANMKARTLTLYKINPADNFQASATVNDGPASPASYTQVNSMTLTPGAGDYLVWFSSSLVTDGTSGDFIHVSLFSGGGQVLHSEREIWIESSIDASPFQSYPVATHAYLTGVGASDAIEVRWRRTGTGTATMHERTLVVQKLSSGGGATFAAAQDTKLTDLAKSTIKRVRFLVSNEGGASSGPVTYELQFAETATCSAGVYTTVPTAGTDHWQVIDSTFTTDGEPTSNISPGLTDEASTFVAGELKDTANTTGSITLNGDEFTEIELAVQATTNATDGGDYCFRLYDATNTQVLDAYTAYAEVQLAGGPASLTLADHDLTQVTDKFTITPAVTDVLFRFKLTRSGLVNVDALRAQFTTSGGVANGDVSAGELWVDVNNDGLVDGGDTLIQGGVTPLSGILTFNTNFSPTALGTNYLVRASVNNLSGSDSTTLSLSAADIDEVEAGVTEFGSTSNAIHTQDAGSGGTIYYSVGTNAADLKAGSPTLTISTGIATFTVAQPVNIGLGDEITYNGVNVAYISGRTSSTVYSVITATGATPGDVAGATVNSIRRAFNSLNAANSGSADLNHLNTFNLAAGNYQLNWTCYDGLMNDVLSTAVGVRVTGWTTSASNYLRIFTPVTSAEVGVSQRHDGTHGTGFRLAPTVGSPGGQFRILNLRVEHVRVEGIEIDGTNVSMAETFDGISVDTMATAGSDVRFDQLIIHDLSNTTIDDSDSSSLRGITMQDGNLKLSNSLIYGLANWSTHSNSFAAAVELNEATATHYLHNNTILDVKQVAAVGAADAMGFVEWSGAASVQNNYVGDVNSVSGNEWCYRTITAETNNVSSDGTATGPGSQINKNSYGAYFVNVTAGGRNLHLVNESSVLWSLSGLDLDGDPNLPIVDDIDSEARDPSTPDVGADEHRATINYRSIGTAGPYLTGTIDVTMGSSVVTGTTTAWLTANRGRGDHIAFNLEEYTVLSVDSETQITLTQPVSGTFTGGYTISRQFTTLQTWEDCISGAGGCTYFPVVGGDLVADDRSEVGIAYNDSVVPGDPDFTDGLRLGGLTTDASHAVKLTADGNNRHYGIPGAGVLIDCSGCLDADDELRIVDTSYVTLEWLEIVGHSGVAADGGIKVIDASTNVLLRFLLIHDNWNGIRLSGVPGTEVIVRNSIVYNNTDIGIEGDEVGDTLLIENSTVYGNGGLGIHGKSSTATVTVRNTISMNNVTDFTNVGTQDFNISEDATASCGTCLANRDTTDLASPGAPPRSGWVIFQDLTPSSENFHLRDNPAENDAQNSATDLSASFMSDIDGGSRSAPWDIGADEIDATTAVELISFDAWPLDGSVELQWETGAELDNLGFHVYRALSFAGAYERLTARPIPGLGSSPVGARYSYRDAGLVNGTTYFYQLEDIDTTGLTTMHGPVSVAPAVGARHPDEADEAEESESTSEESGETTRVTYGDPRANAFRVLREGRNFVELELRTEGFYAIPQDDGTVVLEIPGFDLVGQAGLPSLPAKHHWVDAVAGRKVELRQVRGRMEPITASWSIASETQELVASASGTVTPRTRRRRVSVNAEGLFPAQAARLVMVGFQEESKKALVELAPLRFRSDTGQLFLARRLVVRLSFQSEDTAELSLAGGGRRRVRKFDKTHGVLARFATVERGLYGVRYESLFGAGRALPAHDLRLSRQGSSVAFHVEPDPARFAPGSTLYFLSDGADINPYGNEAVFELSMAGRDDPSAQMIELADFPAGPATGFYWQAVDHELNRYYQPALVDAPDRWLWDLLLAPDTKSYPFQVTALADTVEPARLEVALQGTSDTPADPDHHVRIFINGTFLAEESWNGKTARQLIVDISPGVLLEGDNVVELDNVGDTGASYSTVMLDRFRVVYPRELIAEAGELRGAWSESGTASIANVGSPPIVVDIGEPSSPRWLDVSGASFTAEAGHSYLVVDEAAVRAPELRRPSLTLLTSTRNQADYVVLGPRAFVEAATPLLVHRAEQGLVAKAVAIEDVFDEFGRGESNPEAIRDFLSYAYHEWKAPSPRYVLLLGDASYDYKDYGQTGALNPVPPLMVKTSYLWTVSDPTLAAVNGDDILPDLAIGRLPASSVEDVHTMVGKILAWESAEYGLEGPAVLVADNPDRAGDFVADAESAAARLPRALERKRIYLSELGTLASRDAVIDAFDSGASLMSFIGHGGIHLWADENIFNTSKLSSLAPQPHQPILLTMNCLNGYFHFPYFGSLSEELLKAEGRGVIAAFSPSGLSLNTPAQRLHHAMLDELFSGRHSRLGDAVLDAQKRYLESGAFPELLSIYHLLGDPALRLH